MGLRREAIWQYSWSKSSSQLHLYDKSVADNFGCYGVSCNDASFLFIHWRIPYTKSGSLYEDQLCRRQRVLGSDRCWKMPLVVHVLADFRIVHLKVRDVCVAPIIRGLHDTMNNLQPACPDTRLPDKQRGVVIQGRFPKFVTPNATMTPATQKKKHVQFLRIPSDGYGVTSSTEEHEMHAAWSYVSRARPTNLQYEMRPESTYRRLERQSQSLKGVH